MDRFFMALFAAGPCRAGDFSRTESQKVTFTCHPGDPKLAAQSKTSDATTMGITLGSPGRNRTWVGSLAAGDGFAQMPKKVGDRFTGLYIKNQYFFRDLWKNTNFLTYCTSYFSGSTKTPRVFFGKPKVAEGNRFR